MKIKELIYSMLEEQYTYTELSKYHYSTTRWIGSSLDYLKHNADNVESDYQDLKELFSVLLNNLVENTKDSDILEQEIDKDMLKPIKTDKELNKHILNISKCMLLLLEDCYPSSNLTHINLSASEINERFKLSNKKINDLLVYVHVLVSINLIIKYVEPYTMLFNLFDYYD